MFRLQLSPVFEVKVRFEAQAETGCARAVHEFTARVRRLTDDEADKLGQDVLKERLTDRTIAKRLLVGWGDDVADGSGNPLPYTDANVDAVLNVDGVGSAIVAAWQAARGRAAQGN